MKRPFTLSEKQWLTHYLDQIGQEDHRYSIAQKLIQVINGFPGDEIPEITPEQQYYLMLEAFISEYDDIADLVNLKLAIDKYSVRIEEIKDDLIEKMAVYGVDDLRNALPEEFYNELIIQFISGPIIDLGYFKENLENSRNKERPLSALETYLNKADINDRTFKIDEFEDYLKGKQIEYRKFINSL